MAIGLPRLNAIDVTRLKESSPFRPLNCVWELTLACDLRCTHCGSRAGEPRTGELSTVEALSLVDQLAELECELVTLSGGEPLLRDDWDVIGRACADRGMKVNLVTNGVTVDAAVARRAVEAGFCNVAVSLDGPEAVHDAVRGRGNFARSCEGLRALKAAGMSTAVMTTIHRSTIDHLAETRRVALDVGAAMWRLQLGKPMGCLEGSDTVAPERLLDLIPWLAAMKREGGLHVAVGDSLGYYGPHDRTLRGWGWRGRQERWAGCQAGRFALGLESDGGLKGCLSIQGWHEGDKDLARVGSVREAPLAALWFDPGLFAWNRVFDPASLSGECAKCSKARVCRGGATCVSTAVNGRPGDDPYCYLRVSGQHRGTGVGQAVTRAAATALLLASLAACETDPAANPADTINGDARHDVAAEVATPDASQVDTVDCSTVCCECDYGILPDHVYKQCCEQTQPDTVQPDTVQPDTVQPDTALPDVPPTEVADVKPEAIDCSTVCCMCEYGVIPDDVYKECCTPPQPDVVEPPPDVIPDVKPDAIDCSTVCCTCEYGIIPEDVYKECCTVQPDVVEPPPDVVPDVPVADASPDTPPINCENVCCLCDYGIIPEDVYKECCDPCKDVCCDCDYGEPPPPQCCP
jgi:MoaA/NifB/PqqE/SkfB family radical SAM enzyme